MQRLNSHEYTGAIAGTNGGHAVEVEGSFDNWTTRHPLQRSGKDFTLVKLLPPGVYQVPKQALGQHVAMCLLLIVMLCAFFATCAPARFLIGAAEYITYPTFRCSLTVDKPGNMTSTFHEYYCVTTLHAACSSDSLLMVRGNGPMISLSCGMRRAITSMCLRCMSLSRKTWRVCPALNLHPRPPPGALFCSSCLAPPVTPKSVPYRATASCKQAASLFDSHGNAASSSSGYSSC